jgi:hypothetical protein
MKVQFVVKTDKYFKDEIVELSDKDAEQAVKSKQAKVFKGAKKEEVKDEG